MSGRWSVMRVGAVLFVLGLLFIAVDVLPFFDGDHNRPLWLNLLCLLAPIGFAVVVGSALRRGRSDQRAAAAAVRALQPDSAGRDGSPGRDRAHVAD